MLEVLKSMTRLVGGFKDLPINPTITGSEALTTVPAGKITEMGIFPLLSGAVPISTTSPSILKDREIIALSALSPFPSSGVSIHLRTGLEQAASINMATTAAKMFLIAPPFELLAWNGY
jgi:hypothetical protein